MTGRVLAIGLLTLAAALWPTPGSAKDTHAAKPGAPAQLGAGADAKATGAKDAHGAKPAAAPAQHGAAGAKSVSQKDTHGKPAVPAEHAAGAGAKPASAKGSHGVKPAAGAAPTKPAVVSDAHAPGAHDKAAAAAPKMPTGNDLPSVAARIKQRMQETMAARTQQASRPAAGAVHGAHAAEAPSITRRTTPAVEPIRIRLSWRIGVTWPAELGEPDRQRVSPDDRIALNSR